MVFKTPIALSRLADTSLNAASAVYLRQNRSMARLTCQGRLGYYQTPSSSYTSKIEALQAICVIVSLCRE